MKTSRILQNNKYVIAGAAGKTGRKIVAKLLSSGKQVKAIDSNSKGLAGLKSIGAEPLLGSLTDKDFLRKSFQDADAAFLMIPSQWGSEDYLSFQAEVSNAYVEALQGSSIKYVVNLSMLGAEHHDAPSMLKSLFNLEKQLASISGINTIQLRPTYFMENLLHWTELLRGFRMYGSPFRPEVQFPLVSVEDVASVASQQLLHLGFEGHNTLRLLGPAHISMEEFATMVKDHLGLDHLPYVWLPRSDAFRTLRSIGFSEHCAELHLEIYDKINEGSIISNAVRRPDNTTKYSIECFLKSVFMPHFQGNSAKAG